MKRGVKLPVSNAVACFLSRQVAGDQVNSQAGRRDRKE